jgi:branched-chain amino acid transport system permease protein
MVLIMLWRPKGLLAHREPTIFLRKGEKKKQAGAPA